MLVDTEHADMIEDYMIREHMIEEDMLMIQEVWKYEGYGHMIMNVMKKLRMIRMMTDL